MIRAKQTNEACFTLNTIDSSCAEKMDTKTGFLLIDPFLDVVSE
jgi:hypothetical protein